MAKKYPDERTSKSMKIAVIGGGMMGLTLAYKISKTQAKVKLFERDSQLGGLATYHDYGHFFWDRFYHVILPMDKQLIELIEELGLKDELIWKRTLTGYYVQNKFYSISSLKEFLLFPPLSILSKLRLGLTIFIGSRIKNWKKLEQISVEDWLNKIGGKQTYEEFWRPLLLAKFGESYQQVSAVFIWTYIRRLYRARDSSAHKEQMGVVKGGYKTILDRMQALLNQNNAEIVLNTSVKKISQNPKGGVKIAYHNSEEHFDRLIFTAPLNVLEKVVMPGLVQFSNPKVKVRYLGVICLILITKIEISPYYVLNLSDEKIPFTGVIGMSSVVDLDQTEGYYITYFPKYITEDHSMWKMDVNTLIDEFMKGVKTVYPKLSDSDIVSTHINKAFKVQPLQVLNYSSIIPRVETKHPDIFILNTSQFVDETLNNNSVVKHVNHFMSD